MRKIFLIINFCLLFITPLEAKPRGVEVRPSAKELLETEPRKAVTVAFRVNNKTSEKHEFTSDLELPKGWRLITRDFPFELGANETDIRLVSFFIPQRALAGKYEVTYLVREREYPSISDSYTVYVVVLPVRKLEVKFLQAPEFVIAGEDYEASFIVINESNVPTDVSLKIESEENLPSIVDTEKLRLAPGGSKPVAVWVETDLKLRKILKHRLQLTAQASEDQKVEAKAVSSVEIVPRITGVEESFHRIPIQTTFRQVGGKKTGFHTEISGKGTLDEQGKRHVDFLLRGPDIQDKSVFSEGDEYRFGLWTKDYELHLGNYSSSLSPLTENYGDGRGIKGKLNLNNFGLGGYYQKDGWTKSGEERLAGYIDYLIGEKYRISLNYLRKKELANAEIVSLHGELKPAENTDVELEYASGKRNRKDDEAYLLGVQGYQNRISYYLKFIHAGPDYPGSYSDMDFLSASLAAPLGSKLRLNGYFQQEKHNLDLDPVRDSAASDRRYQLGLSYRFKTGTNLSLEYKNRNREDLLPQPEFDYEEKTYRLRLSHSFKKLTFYPSFEFGKSRDNLTNQSSKLERYTLSTRFRPTRRQSYSGYLRYYNDSNSSGEKRRFMTFGLNSFFQIGNRTSFDFDFQTDDYQVPRHERRNSLKLRLTQILPNKNKISLSGYHTSHENLQGKDETAFMIEYTVPFGFPVSRRKSIGILKGRLYDEETKEAIPDVILRLDGATAVSDKKGNFIFPSLRPGTHYLNVDRAGIGLNRIPVQKTPLKVTVEGGKETFTEIGITQSAALFGQIMLYRFGENHSNNLLQEKSTDRNANYYVVGERINDNASLSSDETKLVKTRELANILVEITNGSEIKRRVTDGKGRFRFEELRPGKWTLKIYDDNLPEYHYFEEDTFEFELKPGEEKEALVRVLPKKRLIRLIDEGGTLVEEEKK